MQRLFHFIDSRPWQLAVIQSAVFLTCILPCSFSCSAEENKTAKPEPFRLDLVPEEAVSASVIRVARLLQEPAAQPLKVFAFDDYHPQFGLLGLNFTEIQSLTLIHLQLQPAQRNRLPRTDVLIVQARQKLDRAQLRKKLSSGKLVETSFQGTSFLTDSAPDGVALLFLDDHTFVHASKTSFLKRIIDQSQKQPNRIWTDRLQPVSSATIFSGVNMQAARTQEEAGANSKRDRTRFFNPSQFSVWKYPDLILQGTSIQDQLTMELIFEQQDHSLEVKQSLSKFVDMMQELIARSQASNPRQPAQPDNRLFEEALNNALVSRSGNRVKLATSLSSQSCNELIKNIITAYTPPAVVARRPDSKTNLKRIMLALLNYEATYRHLPPAVVMGPDGKTPHSWRVEILPYLGHAALYRQYRMNEPWDSKHNLKIAQTVVPEFRHPDSEIPENSCYFAVIGEGTAFGNPKGVASKEISDNHSKAIIIVEAKREIPWTKPEDISYDGKKQLEFGGFQEDGYHVGMFDGSAQFISGMIDKEIIKSMLMIGDGQPQE